VAISRLLGTAMAGRSRGRQELAETPLPFEIGLSPLPSRSGADTIEELFAPLGYRVDCESVALDPTHPEWGDSNYFRVTLAGRQTLADLLTHLFVLVPVLDNRKHYWVGSDEVQKLLEKGRGWLENHPARELITRRYLKHRAGLARWALQELQEMLPVDDDDDGPDEAEEVLEKPVRLNDTRQDRVVEELKDRDVRSVVDLGCGEGRLLRRLLKEPSFSRILGIDVSSVALERAHQRLRVDRMSPRQKERLDLRQGSMLYVDERLNGFDAIACVEVIEHIEPDRLDAFEHAVFAAARPNHVVVTTPNREYNALFENLPVDGRRHRDHRFEWTRAEFAGWSDEVAVRRGYGVRRADIGEVHAEFGAPTQMAVFSR
jgi:3' terminal RNA ribose 2'-O-methyltransferase Hen1